MRTLIATLSFLASSLVAAEEPARQVKASFRTLSLGEPIERAGYLRGRDAVPLTIPSDFFSAPQEYRGPALLAFFQYAAESATPDARTPLRGESARLIAEAERLEAKHAATVQAVAQSLTDAPEGPEGDALRRQAEEILALAEPDAVAARKAREAAAELQRRIDAMNPADLAERKNDRKVGTKRSAPEMSPLGSVPVSDGETMLLLFVRTPQGLRIHKVPENGKHPFGMLCFLNLGERPLTLRAGGRTATAAPLRPEIFTPATDPRGYVGLEIREPGAEGRLLRTLRARPEPTARTTYLLLQTEEGFQLKGVTERAPR